MPIMNLLESKQIENFLTAEEVEKVTRLIESHSSTSAVEGYAQNYNWRYHNPETEAIRNILDPKFKQVFGRTFKVQGAHILDSKNPFMLHGDFNHPGSDADMIPEYTIIIPLSTYDSETIVFNEAIEGTNDFAEYKKNNDKHSKFQLDMKFCRSKLGHLDPKDLLYLSLKEVFPWKSGSMFAMDRRYFHCSSNGVPKRGIVMWTYQ